MLHEMKVERPIILEGTIGDGYDDDGRSMTYVRM
jgi:hypothetical protein